MKKNEITENLKNKIKTMLDKSNSANPIFITTKYGFSKLWKEEKIYIFSWGKNWTDSNPSFIEIDYAIDILLKSKAIKDSV